MKHRKIIRNPGSGSFSENFPVLLPLSHQCHSHRQGSWCDWKCYHVRDSISPGVTSRRRWYHRVLDSVWTSICWWASKSTAALHGSDPKADAFVPWFCGHRETRGRFTSWVGICRCPGWLLRFLDKRSWASSTSASEVSAGCKRSLRSCLHRSLKLRGVEHPSCSSYSHLGRFFLSDRLRYASDAPENKSFRQGIPQLPNETVLYSDNILGTAPWDLADWVICSGKWIQTLPSQDGSTSSYFCPTCRWVCKSQSRSVPWQRAGLINACLVLPETCHCGTFRQEGGTESSFAPEEFPHEKEKAHLSHLTLSLFHHLSSESWDCEPASAGWFTLTLTCWSTGLAGKKSKGMSANSSMILFLLESSSPVLSEFQTWCGSQNPHSPDSCYFWD